MTVRDMVSTVFGPQQVEIRGLDNFIIGIFPQESKGLEPYMDKEVAHWFPYYMPTKKEENVFIIVIRDKEQEHD